MSGIAGVWHLDGVPIEESLLTRMAAPISHRGPDGIGYLARESVGMVNFHCWTTPESVGETLPLTDATNSLSLCFHGRLDNRDELIAALTPGGAVFRTKTDAEIVLHAYELWGENCPARIVGEFAFVIWDARRQQLFCARDVSGWKPFFYFKDRNRFLWASEFPPFFAADDALRQPNEGKIAEFLSGLMVSRDETFYQGIMRLPPAHSLIVTRESTRLTRYWGLDTIQDVRYRSDDEYADQFLDLLQRAVKCQMRVHGRLGAQLSGGLDSTSVVAVAWSLLGEQRSGFEAFSLSFPGADFDETGYIQNAVTHYGLSAHLIDPRVSNPPDLRAFARRYQDIPDYPNGTMEIPLFEMARDRGFRVLLTGHGGDDWFTGSSYHYADLLRGLKLVELYRQFRADTEVVGIVSFPRHVLLHRGFLPLLPPSIYRIQRRIRRRIRRRPFQARPWMNPEFVERVNLAERVRTEPFWLENRHHFARSHLFGSATGAWAAHGFEMEERFAAQFNIELRHPFRYRPLIEFGLGIPEEQRWRGSITKYVLRQAMQGLLPETVRQRRTKAEFSGLIPPAIEALGGVRFLESLTIEQRGWVLGDPMRTVYHDMLNLWRSKDETYRSLAWKLWMVIAVEIWYRECFG